MTPIEAINRIDELKPNTYSIADKLAWLSEFDGKIKLEIIDTHEDGNTEPFVPYTENDLGKPMIIPEPYSVVYINWLESCIDYANGEYGRYNNTIAQFEQKMVEFERYYNRTHMPKGNAISYF